MERYDIEVLRFSNEYIDRRFDMVCKTIDEKVKQRITLHQQTTIAYPCRTNKPPLKGEVAPTPKALVTEGFSPRRQRCDYK
ncbi:MAG: hypothetical protein K6F91_02345 [Ruminococcus sp.]|nr:hypothetical protein [Ruminococcus sp.]